MTEKQFEIICEDYSLVDVPVYVISDDKLKFDIYGSEKDAERLCTLLNENEQLKKEKELIKDKLLKYILNYNKIANDNYNMGLSESVEQIHDEIKELFENPTDWRYLFSCDECTHFKSEKDNYDKAYCQKFKKEISYFEETDCKEFEWK